VSNHAPQIVGFPSASPFSPRTRQEPFALDPQVFEANCASIVPPSAQQNSISATDRLTLRSSDEPNRQTIGQTSELRGELDEAVTLRLHGDVSGTGTPQLQAVLDGVVLLKPTQLIIDLSDVTSVSSDALRIIAMCRVGDADVVVRSAAPRT
jgi:hypothetical protein